MTNEKKERLKGRIYRWYQFASHHTSPSGTSEDREILATILALIDRVPSEEDKAEIDNWMRSLRIGDPESDDDALHVWHILTTIRKALGIEGKE